MSPRTAGQNNTERAALPQAVHIIHGRVIESDLLGVKQQRRFGIFSEVADLTHMYVAQQRRRNEGDAIDIVDDTVNRNAIQRIDERLVA
ncbi:MAG: hypothetical protein ACRD3J_22055, partial [Thermoanaerobaculia bacterium]